MKIGDLVILDHPNDPRSGTIGLILSQKIFFTTQITFEIMWQDGITNDGWVQGASVLRVIS